MEQKKRRIRLLPHRGPYRFWTRVLLTFFLIITGLLTGISILSRSNNVQQWYGNQLAEYLSSRTHHPIEMGLSDAGLFSGIRIHDIRVNDLHNESLIHIETVRTSLRKNIFSLLFHKRINLENLDIDGAKVFVTQYPEDSLTNVQRFIQSFSSKSKDPGACRDVDIRRIKLNNISYIQQIPGRPAIQLGLRKGLVVFGKIDLCDQFIEVNDLYLLEPSLIVANGSESKSKNSIRTKSEESARDTFLFLINHLVLDEGNVVYSKPVQEQKESAGSIQFHHSRILC